MTMAADFSSAWSCSTSWFLQLLWSRRGCQSHFSATGHQCKHNTASHGGSCYINYMRLPPLLNSVGFSTQCECSASNLKRLTCQDHNVPALGHLSPLSPHLSFLSCFQSELLCTSVQNASPTVEKERSGWENTQDTKTEQLRSGWKKEMIRKQKRNYRGKRWWWESAKKGKKEFNYSIFHSFISLSAGAHEVRQHEI